MEIPKVSILTLVIIPLPPKEELGLAKGKIKNYSHSRRFQLDTRMVSLQIEIGAK